MNDGVKAIRYGMFIMPFHDPAKPLAQCYDEDLELIVRAEELGFSEFWIGEHHTIQMPYAALFPTRSQNDRSLLHLPARPSFLRGLLS
jgi:alkanesulfonate monooxygenase SsuD/methylene tetrahydromethanopterin reductase-like flavin-dependent oxidoreductase (luciferase family)